MLFGKEPINWEFLVIEPDRKPQMIASLVIFCIMFVIWLVVVIMCDLYLRRRKKKIMRYFKVDLTYKDDNEKETQYIMTYGWLDICLFFRPIAKTKIQRIRHIEEIDEEFVNLDELIEEVNHADA